MLAVDVKQQVVLWVAMSLSLRNICCTGKAYSGERVVCVLLISGGLSIINSKIRFLALISKSAVTLFHHLGQFSSVYLVVKCVP